VATVAPHKFQRKKKKQFVFFFFFFLSLNKVTMET
jgi:hypothetical protein